MEEPDDADTEVADVKSGAGANKEEVDKNAAEEYKGEEIGVGKEWGVGKEVKTCAEERDGGGSEYSGGKTILRDHGSFAGSGVGVSKPAAMTCSCNRSAGTHCALPALMMAGLVEEEVQDQPKPVSGSDDGGESRSTCNAGNGAAK